jgi:hypothetical protein
MVNKKRVVQWFVRWTDSWNREFHEAIERNVQNEFKRMFPDGAKDTEAMIEKMRGFYYARMTNTSTLLVAIIALLVSFLALVVSLVSVLPALLHK